MLWPVSRVLLEVSEVSKAPGDTLPACGSSGSSGLWDSQLVGSVHFEVHFEQHGGPMRLIDPQPTVHVEQPDSSANPAPAQRLEAFHCAHTPLPVLEFSG